MHKSKQEAVYIWCLYVTMLAVLPSCPQILRSHVRMEDQGDDAPGPAGAAADGGHGVCEIITAPPVSWWRPCGL